MRHSPICMCWRQRCTRSKHSPNKRSFAEQVRVFATSCLRGRPNATILRGSARSHAAKERDTRTHAAPETNAGTHASTRTSSRAPMISRRRELRAAEDRSLAAIQFALLFWGRIAPALEARAQRVRVQPQPPGRAVLALDHPVRRLGKRARDVLALDLGHGGGRQRGRWRSRRDPRTPRASTPRAARRAARQGERRRRASLRRAKITARSIAFRSSRTLPGQS